MLKAHLLVMGILLFLSSLYGCRPKGDFESLSVDEFASRIENEEVQRLDVRTPGEYSEGRIKKFININVLDDSFGAMADTLLEKNRPVALYCRSGKRSKKAAMILSEKGYKVLELDEGFNAWQMAGKDIER